MACVEPSRRRQRGRRQHLCDLLLELHGSPGAPPPPPPRACATKLAPSQPRASSSAPKRWRRSALSCIYIAIPQSNTRTIFLLLMTLQFCAMDHNHRLTTRSIYHYMFVNVCFVRRYLNDAPCADSQIRHKRRLLPHAYIRFYNFAFVLSPRLSGDRG